MAVIRRGIPASAVDALTRLTHLSQAELASAVGIPERTLARRKREVNLNRPDETNYLLNPRHPDVGRIAVGAARELITDSRRVRIQSQS